jgi:TPR repeat protein
MTAAEGGSAFGHFLVGSFIEHGFGVTGSRADALSWYASGAALGNGRAAAALARLQAEEE